MVAPAENNTVSRLIIVRENAAFGLDMRAADARSLLVVDDALRRVSEVKGRTGPGRQIRLFVIKEITLFEQSHRLQTPAAYQHRGPLHIIWRARSRRDPRRGEFLQRPCAPAPSTISASPQSLDLMR